MPGDDQLKEGGGAENSAAATPVPSDENNGSTALKQLQDEFVQHKQLQVRLENDGQETRRQVTTLQTNVTELESQLQALEVREEKLAEKEIQDFKNTLQECLEKMDRKLENIAERLRNRVDGNRTAINQLAQSHKETTERQQVLTGQFDMLSRDMAALKLDMAKAPTDATKSGDETSPLDGGLGTLQPMARGVVQDHVYRPLDTKAPPQGPARDLAAGSSSYPSNTTFRKELQPPAYPPTLNRTAPNFDTSTPVVASPYRTLQGDGPKWRPRSKLPEFDGTSKFKPFLARFETMAEQYQLSSGDMARMLGECLKGSAADYYADLSPHIRGSYDSLKAKLSALYGVKESRGHYQMKLAAIQQAEDQDLVEFAMEVHHLAQEAFPGEAESSASAAAQNFLRGCHLKEAARWAMDKRPATLEEALSLVRTWVDTDAILYPKEDKKKKTSRKPSPEPALRAVQTYSRASSSSNGRYENSPRDRSPSQRDRYASSHRYESRPSHDRSYRDRQASRSPSPYYRDTASRSPSRDPARDSRARDYDRPRQRDLDSSSSKDSEFESSILELVRKVSGALLGKATNSDSSRGPSPGEGRSRRDSPTSSRGRDRAPSPRASSPRDTCYRCGRQGHYSRECPDDRGSPGSTPRRVSFSDGDASN